MSISSIGIGSGVLTSDLIDQLAEAERAPTELRLDRKEAEVEAKLSAVGRVRSALTDLRLPSRVLSNPDALNAVVANSTSSNVAVTADSGAKAGQYTVEVAELAQTQSLSTGTFADQDATAMGTGTLSFKVGDTTTDITIDSTNNTLAGIASAINAEEDLNVNASVIDTGAGFVLVFSAQDSGLENAMEITVTDTGDGNNDDANGLSQFAFNTTASNLTESVEAKDASFSVNGISITRSSNTITDVIDGLSFTLTGKTAGSPATVGVTIDAETVLGRVQEFIDKFNEVKTALNELTEFNPASAADSGVLLGDSTIRSINSQLREVIGQVVPGLDGSVRSLAEIGISSDSTKGTLSIDETVFKKQLTENPGDLVALFADQGRTSGAQVSFESKSVNTVPGSYDINITQAATQGNVTGSIALGELDTFTIDNTNNTFKLNVDGVESGEITLADASYNRAQLLTVLQAQIDGDTNLSSAGKYLTVSIDGTGQMQLTSKSYGSASSIEFANPENYLFDDQFVGTPTSVAGLDVAGTINGEEGTGSGQKLSAAVGDDSEGIVVKVEGTTTGDRGQVTYIEGVAEQLVDKLNTFLEFNGVIGAKENGYNENLLEIADQRLQLDERVETLRKRLSLQFTSADILVGQLNNTKDFLKSQFDAMAGKSE